jgi:hypothetical protein
MHRNTKGESPCVANVKNCVQNCPYKGPLSWACNTQYPATRSQVHWGWWRHLWKFVMRCARLGRGTVWSLVDYEYHMCEFLHACNVSCDVIYYVIAVRARRMVRIFFLPYLGNCSKSDPCSYELFCLESHIPSFPKVLQIPPESPCITPAYSAFVNTQHRDLICLDWKIWY